MSKSHHFPLAYRWFLSKGLTDWEPWYFTDDAASVQQRPDFSKNEFASRAFAVETGADFDVYLFARRQDMDDYAFFVVRDGKIEDKVMTIHLSFAKRFELKTPLLYSQVHRRFMQWVGEVVVADVADWMSEDDIGDNAL
jgi:hypothetical protein